MSERQSLRIALVAGEVSGDNLGASLMAAFKEQHRGKIEFCGLGGINMAGEGLESPFAIEEIALVGFLDILLHIPALLRRVRQTAESIIAANPDILVVIDSPDFTHRVARRVKRALPDLPVVNYSPPQVWSWRSWRAVKMNEYINRTITLFPFEAMEMTMLEGPESFYEGHPLVQTRFDKPAGAALRREYGLREGQDLVLLAPGSRTRELMRMVPLLADSARRVQREKPEAVFFWLAAEGQEARLAALVTEQGEGVSTRITGDKMAALTAADLSLATSGTINLELALAGVPFICVYRLSWLEERIVAALSRAEMVSLVNLNLGRVVVPEFYLRAHARPERIAPALLALWPSEAREIQSAAFLEMRRLLEAGSDLPPAQRAARRILEMVG